MLEFIFSYYYLILIVQAICIFHAYRSGNLQKWIWLLLFLPLIGCIIYVYSELLTKRNVGSLQSTVTSIVYPIGRIKELEKQYQFSDTFTNLVRLADAYLATESFDKAIALYEKGLTGTFSDNEHVMKQMVIAYYHLGRYEDAIKIAAKLKHDISFSKSESNLLFALSLEQVGRVDFAEKEFAAMNHRYSNYEARFRFGEFLMRQNRKDEALRLYEEIANEAKHMSRAEKGDSSIWINKSIDAYRKG